MNTVEKIIRELEDGKSINKVAMEAGFSSKFALGDFMIREGYSWDSEERKYIKKESEFKEYKEYRNTHEPRKNDLNKIMQILALFDEEKYSKSILLELDDVLYGELKTISESKGEDLKETALRLIKKGLEHQN